ncbi:U3 small nucleolar ribonucleoprotein Lcp5 [Arthroderma uncinatum]|uniref:U3 small nucleolar ribonucleoprotein Lcp5 n=1 Tax=Arthroderma uncinatum TaxID=74035 RepID=UPI00144A8FF5|nr:U3 small nucleolar ribonucleoprotein Lcp5 [Arthroderma uncinatum]KAF3482606.1 U3 small nucleolar ribonucleoprotein Lcp5 [Arthroderma uncinatum]
MGSQSPTASMLESLQQSLSSAASALPTSISTEDGTTGASILPPVDGISLLDTKSEILLSYLQNLACLILLQVRQLSSSQVNPPSAVNGAERKADAHQKDVIKKLTELRVYLERGVRPLEGRLKYQIDKVLKAAGDAERTKPQPSQERNKQKATKKQPNLDTDGADSEPDTATDNGSDPGDSGEDEEEVDELTYRPNVAAFSRAAEAQEQKAAAQKKDTPGDGIYRPPRIKPTALLEHKPSRRAEREAQRSKKSKAIDEFVSAEMSAAPMAEPSIGSTIRAGGRHVSTRQDRAKEEERRTYEETNLLRLPKESKKDRAKRGGNRRGGYGGEEWQGLGEGVDRIHRLTQRKKDSGSALQRSRKRATEDGPRGDGLNIGERFEKRQKTIASWKR